MGEEVKITVIATGFRDQMPERRARMLSVEESPVVSVPVVAPDNWLPETAPQPAPAPPRFLSEEEEETDAGNNNDDGFFFAAATPNVATTLTVATPQPVAASGASTDFAMEHESAPAAETQQFDDMENEPEFKTPPRDYVADFIVTPREAMDEQMADEPMAEQAQGPEPSLFSESAAEPERDLDVPTFLRRLKF